MKYEVSIVANLLITYIFIFHKMRILSEKNYAFVHLADQKNRLHTCDFAYSSLHFKQERRNWSPTFFNPSPSPSPPFYTHAHKQVNAKSYHALKSFPSKKKRRGAQDGPLTRPGLPPAGGAVPPALILIDYLDKVIWFCLSWRSPLLLIYL